MFQQRATSFETVIGERRMVCKTMSLACVTHRIKGEIWLLFVLLIILFGVICHSKMLQMEIEDLRTQLREANKQKLDMT